MENLYIESHNFPKMGNIPSGRLSADSSQGHVPMSASFSPASELCTQIRFLAARLRLSPALVFAGALAVYLSRVDGQEVPALSFQSSPLEPPLLLQTDPQKSDSFSSLCRTLNTLRDFSPQAALENAIGFFFSFIPDKQLDSTESFSAWELPLPAPLLLVREGKEGNYSLSFYAGGRYTGYEELSLLGRMILQLLEDASGCPESHPDSLNYWPAADKARVKYGFNPPADILGETVVSLFSTIAEQVPEQAALVIRDTVVPYRALDEASSRIAGMLIRRGTPPGSLVAVLIRRSIRLAECLLGILKAGCAFLILDPDDPEERNSYILTDSGAPLCIVEREADLPDGCRPLLEDQLDGMAETFLPHIPPPLSDTLCCMLYQMGALGRPLGIGIEHRTIARLSHPTCSAYHEALKTRGRGALSMSPIGSEAFLLEFFPPLLMGIPVFLPDTQEENNPALLGAQMSALGINTAVLFPNRLKSLLQEDTVAAALKGGVAYLWGRPVSPELLCALQEADICPFSGYGSAESGLCAACGPADVGDAVGYPTAGSPIYILSPRGELLPPGASGEIAVAGLGIARESASLLDSFSWFETQRIYRTGDYGSFDLDGILHLAKRRDRRRFLKGQRLEPAEIESRIGSSPQIGQCAVLLVGCPEEEELLCFYTARRDIPPEGVLAWAAGFLPAFAVPYRAIRLERMPLDHNGAVDYAALERIGLTEKEESLPEEAAPTRGTDDISLYEYREIRKQLSLNRPPVTGGREELGTILLTGATGYLGIHVLYELALKYSGNVYCLVRSKNGLEPERRLRSTLFYYFETSFQSLFGKRIFVVDGDVTRPGLGISQELPHIDTVINCAGYVYELSGEETLLRSNLTSVRNLICFCQEHDARLIHISAMGIGGFISPLKRREGICLSESGLYVGQSLANPYYKSKFLAEREVLQAICGGLRAKVLRLGNLQGRFSDGEFQMNVAANRFTRQLCSCVLTGVCSEEFAETVIRFCPVDLAATALLMLARMPDQYSVFHIVDEHGLPVSFFLDRLRRMGHSVHVLSGTDFAEHIGELARSDEGSDAVEGFLLGPQGEKGLVETPCRNDFSLECLHRFGFEWPELTTDYLDRVLLGLETLGLFD